MASSINPRLDAHSVVYELGYTVSSGLYVPFVRVNMVNGNIIIDLKRVYGLRALRKIISPSTYACFLFSVLCHFQC